MYVEEEAEQLEKKYKYIIYVCMYMFEKQRNEKRLVDGGKVWQRCKFTYFHFISFNIQCGKSPYM